MCSTPAERALAARVAAFTLHSRVDSREHTLPARRAFLARFLADIPEDLPEDERRRRAAAARRAYFARLALRSAQARRQRAQRRRLVRDINEDAAPQPEAAS